MHRHVFGRGIGFQSIVCLKEIFRSAIPTTYLFFWHYFPSNHFQWGNRIILIIKLILIYIASIAHSKYANFDQLAGSYCCHTKCVGPLLDQLQKTSSHFCWNSIQRCDSRVVRMTHNVDCNALQLSVSWRL